MGPEFEEVTVQLEERVKTHWQDYLRQGIHQGMQQGRQEGKLEERNRILTLLKRGYTPEQLETLLAQDVNPTKSSPKA
jgi:flagellar biosynthesis/type III secretory pathway protein FliH